ncbi:MAG: 3-keto-disaccharide hydrolase [Limisphaerales bacterium]
MKNIWISIFVAGSFFTSSVFAQTNADKPLPAKPDKKGWIKLFDGKTLSGWTAPDPGEWKMENGILKGSGGRSHLFSPNTYSNLEFKAEVKLNHSGNSGMYFRAEVGPGWPKGYEAQVENTSPDPQKTGSLYNAPERHFHPLPIPVREQLIQDDTWWTQHIIAIGNRIIIKVNDKIVTDFVDENKTFSSGHLAFQQHNQGSEVQFRNVMVKPLPADEKSAWQEAKKDMPDISMEPKRK